MKGRQRVAVVNSGPSAVCGGRACFLQAWGTVMEPAMEPGGGRFADLASLGTDQCLLAAVASPELPTMHPHSPVLYSAFNHADFALSAPTGALFL